MLDFRTTRQVALLILFTLSGRIHAVSSSECKRYLQQVWQSGSDPTQFPIPSVVYHRPADKEHFPADSIPGYDPDALYIGVQNSSNGTHHYYLVVRNVRYEIKRIFSSARIKDFEEDVPLFTKGMLFELKIGPEGAGELVAALDSSFHFDCLHAICKPLHKTGIFFHEKGTFLWAKTFDSALLQGKFFRKDGSQIPMRILYENPDELNHFVHSGFTADEVVLASYAPYLAVAGIFSSGLLGITVVKLWPEKKRKRKPRDKDEVNSSSQEPNPVGPD